jgi:hypothetical protein
MNIQQLEELPVKIEDLIPKDQRNLYFIIYKTNSLFKKQCFDIFNKYTSQKDLSIKIQLELITKDILLLMNSKIISCNDLLLSEYENDLDKYESEIKQLKKKIDEINNKIINKQVLTLEDTTIPTTIDLVPNNNTRLKKRYERLNKLLELEFN